MKLKSNPEYFEVVGGNTLVTCEDVYVLGRIDGNCFIRKLNGWNITFDKEIMMSIAGTCFNGKIYSGRIEIVRISNGTIDWVKNLVVKKVGYEGTRDNPIPVYYESLLNVFDIENDGKYLYLNTRDGIVKTDADLNVIWAVTISRQNGTPLNDDIAVSDGIYATRWNHIIKLNKDGELEWAVDLKSDEKIKLEIPKEKKGKTPEFSEIDKYWIDLYTIYAENYVYIAGLAHEHLNNPLYERVYPFLAKLDVDGNLLWARIMNVQYPKPGTYVMEGRIVKDGDRFIAFISNYILFTFDKNGRILDFYVLNGNVEDIGLHDDKIYLAIRPELKEKPSEEATKEITREVKIERRDATSIPINLKTVKQKLKVRRVECYSKVLGSYSV